MLQVHIMQIQPEEWRHLPNNNRQDRQCVKIQKRAIIGWIIALFVYKKIKEKIERRLYGTDNV